MSRKKTPPTPPNISWCSLHNTDRHDNSDCRSQIRDGSITRRPRPDQQNGRHKNNRSAHANTATTPTSTTQTEAYVPVIHAPSTTAAATTAATYTSFATSPCPTSPPVGIAYFLITDKPRCTEDGEARYTQPNRQCTDKRFAYHNSATRLQWIEEGEGSLKGSRAHRITTILPLSV